MAYENINSPKSINATASLAGNQFCFVAVDSNGGIVLAGAGTTAIGVLQDKPGAGDPGFVCGPGDITKMQFGGTVNPGQGIVSNAAGQAVVSGATGTPCLGIALQAGAAGGIASVLFQPCTAP